jgi:hypothetical protein
VYVIIGGNVIDGITIFGPFEAFEDAEEWAISGERWEWLISEITPV